MSASPSRFRQFRTDIRRLIAEVEHYMRATPHATDREYNLQCEVFEERCDRARQLAEQISANEQAMWGLHDGDAQRLQDSLMLSLDYFRTDGRADGYSDS